MTLNVLSNTRPAAERIPVYVVAGDPVSRDGVASQLRGHLVELVDEHRLGGDVVAILLVEELDEEAVGRIRALRRRGIERVISVATRIDDAGLLAAVGAGASSVLRRDQATSTNLSGAIKAAAHGDGSLPPDLLGRLLGQVSRIERQVLSPRGLTFSGLTEREARVLRLLADGQSTVEIGRCLFISERTVKNVIHDVSSRFNLNNRTHAVAYALREGLI
jgi:DNA-binding NarL/FixJ family response regulator